ncbi:MAG: 5'-methylthioadenosine/adenosylhomocysteine nucleosidase [Eubacteriales bacterium]|nr:5'-methylthioadenosine/adenosylhomocysteine nucleosidase [Eubacteriales bacterium]
MKIGIIGAMDLEINNLITHLSKSRTSTIAKKLFYEGEINNIEIVICLSGIGKVNASISTEILIEHFKVTHIINSGIAGALNVNLKILDIVISKDLIQHDMDCTFFGYKLGEIPQMKMREFIANDFLIENVYESAKSIYKEKNIIKGRILSGDKFISDDNIKNKLFKEFDGDCTEMEGAAIAQVAYLNNIPFVSLRVISDNADGNANIDYNRMEEEAANCSSNIVLEFINNIGEQK